MKKNLLILLSLIPFLGISQTIVTTLPQEKNVVLEEFTGITCGYCPDGHFRGTQLSTNNPGRVVLINIHQGSYSVPSGTRPDFRTQFGDALASNSGISGYPSGTVNRKTFSGLSTVNSLSRNQWATAAERVLPEQSPVNIATWSTINTTTRELTVFVETYYTLSSASSSNFIHVALLQDSVLGWQTDYASPAYPGGNTNNYVHKHIFRHFITGQWGDAITSTTAGSTTLRTYTYTIPDSIGNRPVIIDKCKLAVFISENHNNIYTGINVEFNDTTNGETKVYAGSLTGTSNQAALGALGVESTLSYNAVNALNSNQDFQFTLTTDAPTDWQYDFEINSNTYSDSAQVTFTGNQSINFDLHVTPGNTVKFAKFTLKMESLNNPSSTPKTFEYYVVYGITDLIVNGSGAFGDGNTYNFTQIYKKGLAYAGNTNYDAIPADIMQKASLTGILDNINNIYLNIGWTFPSFSDNEATALINFMNNGGNVFAAGQDMAWDIQSGSGYGTTITKNLFTNYFNVVYVADGSTANNQLIPTSNHIFKHVGTSTIVDKYAGNMYPDELNTRNGSVAIFNYNATKKGGIRYRNNNFKVVYLGIGLEMIADTNVAKNIMKRAHDWFYGLILDAEMVVVQNNQCSNGCTGILAVNQTGGSASPSYEWSNQSQDTLAQALCVGTHTVTISNATDTMILSGSITAPNALAIAMHQTGAQCDTCANGKVWVTVTGESGDYSFLWNDNSQSTNDTVLNLLPGSYIVTVTDNLCGTSIQDTIEVASYNGIDLEYLTQFKIFPNPANHSITIQAENSWYNEIEIIDLVGKSLMKKSTNNSLNSLDISTLPQGSYYIILKGKEANSTSLIHIVR